MHLYSLGRDGNVMIYKLILTNNYQNVLARFVLSNNQLISKNMHDQESIMISYWSETKQNLPYK